jgi:hypothetical protein
MLTVLVSPAASMTILIRMANGMASAPIGDAQAAGAVPAQPISRTDRVSPSLSDIICIAVPSSSPSILIRRLTPTRPIAVFKADNSALPGFMRRNRDTKKTAAGINKTGPVCCKMLIKTSVCPIVLKPQN